MSKQEALDILIETAHIAQKTGALSLDQASIVREAIILLKELFKTTSETTEENKTE